MHNYPNWTRIDCNSNGCPRYVCHFLLLNTREEKYGSRYYSVEEKYALALKRSRPFKGKKFHNKQFGGGIVFATYDIDGLIDRIGDAVSLSQV